MWLWRHMNVSKALHVMGTDWDILSFMIQSTNAKKKKNLKS